MRPCMFLSSSIFFQLFLAPLVACPGRVSCKPKRFAAPPGTSLPAACSSDRARQRGALHHSSSFLQPPHSHPVPTLYPPNAYPPPTHPPTPAPGPDNWMRTWVGARPIENPQYHATGLCARLRRETRRELRGRGGVAAALLPREDGGE